MIKRALGRANVQLSVIGFGGILVMDETPADAARLVAKAIDRGVNYFDVAPTYGNAEERLGPALEPYRRDVFLACKTTKRDKAGAAAELRNSLKLLRTDRFDLYQMHALTTSEDIEQAFGPGGAHEAFVEAKREGLVRYLGFSAHSEEAALAAMDRLEFDSVLFPFSLTIWHQGKFGPRVLEKAKAKGMGTLALKALAKRPWRKDEKKTHAKCWYKPVDSYEEAVPRLRFTLSLGVTAAVTPGHETLFDWACDAAEEFAELPESEWAATAAAAADADPIFQQFQQGR